MLPKSLNFYPHSRLKIYTHYEIKGTLHFSVVSFAETAITEMSKVSGKNSAAVSFFSTHIVDKWECRATLYGQPHGVGIGILLTGGDAVEAGVTMDFNIMSDLLTFGDGKYRIDVFVQYRGIWYGDNNYTHDEFINL